jgi:hypothetical protein
LAATPDRARYTTHGRSFFFSLGLRKVSEVAATNVATGRVGDAFIADGLLG